MTTEQAKVGKFDLMSLSPKDLKRASLRDLDDLAAQIREFLIESVSRTGGHIGANLGTVELALGIHRVFDSPVDRVIWDTGHQGYTQKIVTGRAKLFSSLNSFRGMSRFLTRTESEHDVIESSHGGTSISVSLGIAVAKSLKNDPAYAVAVIGDGSLCEGLALEALNHAGVLKTKLVIVLNDNGYAISPGYGALHQHLQSLTPGKTSSNIFSALGFNYIGPVDGHDVSAVTAALEKAKSSSTIPVVHVRTEKGHGLKAADGHPFRMHFSFAFDPVTGTPKPGTAYVGYQDAAAKVIGEEMEADEKIVAITPSTLYASGLSPVFKKFPDRCFDPGMEEQHAMTMTVGFALEGYKPVIVYQSTFMQRAYDQLFHDVCFTNQPTLILAVRSGFAGNDNPTHHGIYDMAYLRGLPNLRVFYPKDRYEVERMVRDNLRSLTGPTLIAMPYGPVDEIEPAVAHESPASFAQPQLAVAGRDMMIVTVGNKFRASREAAERLRARGVDCGLINLRQIKPLPVDALQKHLAGVPRVVSVEEGVLEGGVGSALAALILDRGLDCELLRVGIDCAFVEAGTNDELCKLHGLDADGITRKIESRWQLK